LAAAEKGGASSSAGFRRLWKTAALLASAPSPAPAPASRAAPFPSLDHLHYSEFAGLYEPAEDTFLLCDALADAFGDGAGALAAGSAAAAPALAVEVGPGSGAVSAHLGALLAARGRARPATLCVDVSPRACAATLRTAAANGAGGTVEAVLGDLLGCALPRLAGRVDVLLFNPPYVPTPDAEVLGPARAAALAAAVACGGHGGGGAGGEPTAAAEAAAADAAADAMLAAAWAGGERGRRVLDRALPQVARALSAGGGAAFVVLVEENVPDEVARDARALGLAASVVRRGTAKNERLLVMRLVRE
jgi:release factor glutamine methyltransferase